jgi:chromosome segregation ATPase
LDDDYQRRYDLALNDLRDLKAKNAELQQQLDDANAMAASLATQNRASSGRLDWEAEKRRTLTALEADFDEHDAPQYGQRLEIEDVLHTTEQVIAAKDRQIRDLEQRLEEQRGNIGAGAPDTAAINQAIDSDAVVQKERERLKELQEESRDKLRQAEIELSLERAKLARQRAELEERFNARESDLPKLPTAAGAERPASRRWLTRLGLTEADKEPGRR